MNNRLEKLLTDPSFTRWLKDRASPKEEEKWEAWLREEPDQQVLVREAKEIVIAVDSEYEPPDPERQLAKLNQDIDQYERHQRRKKVIFTFSGDNQAYRKIGCYAAAAVLLIAVILGGVMGYYANGGMQTPDQQMAEKPTIKEYSTDYGEKLTFRLSDGSKIMLNGNSSLIFSSTVEKGLNTEVRLKGEAYFDIAHLEGKQKRTFTVHTNDGTVSVLGTRFGINTFRDQTKAVLEEGKIKIQNKGSAATYELVPGQMAQFKSNDNKVAIQEVNTELYTSWTKNKFIFDNAPMGNVVRRIEDVFGVEVILGSSLQQERLSGSIKSTNLKVLKQALEEVLKAEVKQVDQQLQIGEG
jgi:ferric-dicitrate binding protein FerR (iron transport regulator)